MSDVEVWVLGGSFFCAPTRHADSLGQINHHPPLQLLRIHLPKHIRQRAHPLDPVMRLHDAPSRKLDRFNRLLARPHRRPDNLQRLGDQNPRIRRPDGFHVALGDADADHAAAEAQQVDRDVVRALVRGAYYDGVGAVAAGHGFDGVGERVGAVEGEEVLGAAGQDEVFFRRVVDADYAVADGARAVLHLPSVSVSAT